MFIAFITNYTNDSVIYKYHINVYINILTFYVIIRNAYKMKFLSKSLKYTLLTCCILWTNTAYARSTIFIAEISDDLSHPNLSIHYKRGWQLAQETLEKSDILSFKVKVQEYSLGPDKKQAQKKLTKTILLNRPIAMFGTLGKENTQIVKNIAEKHKIPFFASLPLFGNNRFANLGNYSFVMRPSLSANLAAMARYISYHTTIKKIGILASNDDDMIQAVEYFKTKIFGFGFSDILYENYGDSANVKDMLEDVPVELDALLLGYTHKDIFKIINSDFSVKNKLTKFRIMASSLGELDLETLNNAAIPDGWLTTGYPWYSISSSNHDAFVNEYLKRWKTPPTYASIISYITYYAMINAISNASTTLGTDIVEVIEGRQLTSPLGSFYLQKDDHQSSLGVFAGLVATKQGKKIMDRWRYFNGLDLLKIDDSYYELFAKFIIEREKIDPIRHLFSPVSLDNWDFRKNKED